jgi:beta-glucosidase
MINQLIQLTRMGTALTFMCAAMQLAAEQLPYQNPVLPVDQRVADLVARMTLDEKIAQLQTRWWEMAEFLDEKGNFLPENAKKIMAQGIGELARPGQNKNNYAPNKTPQKSAEFTNAIQRWLKDNTRLGIPAIFHEEALHGHSGLYSTSFPQAIALASTWQPTLFEQIYTHVAKEVRCRGSQRVLAPVLDVARDPRWGRIEETLGEDPYLVASLGVAAVKGFQGAGPNPDAQHVITTLKHLAGHGEPSGGLNTAPAMIGERLLREVFLFPFEAVIKNAHPGSVMASYNEIDGVPSHGNHQLLQTILRKEWGFNGIVVSDYYAIPELATRHHLAADKYGAAIAAFNAGVTIETPLGDAYPQLKRAVEEGKISVAKIDQAVAGVLKQKFVLGLFENPFVDAKKAEACVGNQSARTVALTAAEQSIVLLKNDRNLLPLNKKSLHSIAVIGPHVQETLLGGYSDVPRQTTSILQGIKNYLGPKIAVKTALGVKITDDNWKPGSDSIAANTFSKERWNTDVITPSDPAKNRTLIKEAVDLAAQSDVTVVVVGDNEGTSREAWGEEHLGDRTDVTLFGQQQELVDALLAVGKPLVVVLNNGRPLAIEKINSTAPAIIEAWYLGQETGTALARVLFGEVNPGGKLPVSIPRNVGQLPVYYNYKPTAKRGYAFAQTSPLYSFGYGLSYTQFSYSDLTIERAQLGVNDTLNAKIKITNTGAVDGDEVVQLYINDEVASLTRPVKELKAFKRIHLKAKQSRWLEFSVPVALMGFYNEQMIYQVEPGKISIQVGSSSADIRQQQAVDIQGEAPVAVTKQFFSTVREL